MSDKSTINDTIQSEATSMKSQDSRKSPVQVSIELLARNSTYEVKIKSKTEVDHISNVIDAIVSQISKSKSFQPAAVMTPTQIQRAEPSHLTAEEPLRLFATKIEVDPNAFEKSNLVAIKNDSVQLLKPSALKQSESSYLLLAVNEYVFGRRSMTYDEWRELCQSSKIKGNSPFHKIVDNAKRLGHINQKKYDNAKEIVLEPRGVKFLRRAIERYLGTGKGSSISDKL